MIRKYRLRFLALAMACALTGGCANTTSSVDEILAVAEPNARPVRLVTSLDAALSCMDGQFLKHRIAPKSIMAISINDDTGQEIGGGRTSMLIVGDFADECWLVFGFAMQRAREPLSLMPAADVYAVKTILERKHSDTEDWAVMELHRPVSHRQPLNFRGTGTPAKGTRLTIAGHPLGLPLKMADGGVLH